MSIFERIGGDVRMQPAGPAGGTATLPGSKSLTNRALFCAALADGVSRLRGASLADDGLIMVDALRSLGMRVEVTDDPPTLTVRGCRGHLPAIDADINTGPAGTATRFVTALCCLGRGRYRVDGDARMRQRPIGVLVDALHELGAGIGYEATPGCPPLTIAASGLRGGEVTLHDPPSSQFVSAVLMAAPAASADVLLRVAGATPSRPYIDMTTDLMRDFGVETIAGDDARWIVPAPQPYRAADVVIEPDASAATYAWAAAAITGGRVRVAGLGAASRQGDARFVDVLERMGCGVERAADATMVSAPADGLRGIDVDLNAMPDTVQTLAVVALFAEGPTTVRNVANLRVKETDRITALAAELAKLGARVEARPDGLTVHPPLAGVARGAAIRTYADHRMAMSLALAGLRIEGVVIRDAGCVSKSFPDYFEALAGLFGGAAD